MKGVCATVSTFSTSVGRRCNPMVVRADEDTRRCGRPRARGATVRRRPDAVRGLSSTASLCGGAAHPGVADDHRVNHTNVLDLIATRGAHWSRQHVGVGRTQIRMVRVSPATVGAGNRPVTTPIYRLPANPSTTRWPSSSQSRGPGRERYPLIAEELPLEERPSGPPHLSDLDKFSEGSRPTSARRTTRRLRAEPWPGPWRASALSVAVRVSPRSPSWFIGDSATLI
jgi:hypothetical protein